MRPLEVIAAGAGSGKTHLIKETLRKRVVEGKVRPERIVAVTFSEAAAAELRERIRSTLVEAGRLEDALKLDRAYISTIHGFGLRLLTEHAFEGGLPPHSRLLDTNEEAALIRSAIASSGDVEVLTKELSRYGYTWDPVRSNSAEDQFRKMVLQVIGSLRSIGRLTPGDILASWAKARIHGGYGPVCDATTAIDALHRVVQDMLLSFTEDISAKYEGNASAVKSFGDNHRDLVAASDKNRLQWDWKLWQRLRKLRKSTRDAPTPDGYDGLAAAVMAAANELPHHPGPLQDAERHAETLIRSADEAIGVYAEEKRSFALVDYTDMVAGAFDLLRTEPGVLASLRDRVDCLVVDEFQDTNPLQHALLWLMRDAGVPTLVVGDLKQAIMGFQGADPRLMENLLADPDAHAEPLKQNWRTQPSLMPFINAVGRSLFGGAYTDLEPKAAVGAQPPLEVIEHPKPSKGGSKATVRAARTAERIAQLLRLGTETVRDRQTGEIRPLVPGDIAVLHPVHKGLGQYATALRQFGIKARITEDGWFTSRTVEIARHALEFAADPSDRHAALYLACTELGSHTPESACRQLAADGEISDQILDRLKAAIDPSNALTVDGLLAAVLSATGLYGVASTWPDAAQHRANLLRLEAEAKEFISSKPETLASGGFFGSGVKTFLAWLEDRIALKNGDLLPPVTDEGGDAVQLLTWHASKGREWPVVVVCGWDRDVKATLPDLSVEYEGFSNLSELLPKARLTFVPSFAAPETSDRYIDAKQAEERETTKRLIYVAMTRARERLIFEWDTHLSNSKRNTYHSLFSETAKARLLPDAIEINGVTWPCIVTTNDGTPPVIDEVDATEWLPVVGRRAIAPRPSLDESPEQFATPSAALVAKAPCPTSGVEVYGDPLRLDLELPGTVYGTLVHRCFEVLGQNPALADRLSDAVGYPLTQGQIAVLTQGAAKFETWLQERLAPVEIMREWPFVAQDDAGTVWSGTIDCLVKTAEGWWIIDHKTEGGGDAGAAVERHWPQLDSYRATLEAMGIAVAGVVVNLVNEGKVGVARI